MLSSSTAVKVVDILELAAAAFAAAILETGSGGPAQILLMNAGVNLTGTLSD